MKRADVKEAIEKLQEAADRIETAWNHTHQGINTLELSRANSAINALNRAHALGYKED